MGDVKSEWSIASSGEGRRRSFVKLTESELEPYSALLVVHLWIYERNVLPLSIQFYDAILKLIFRRSALWPLFCRQQLHVLSFFPLTWYKYIRSDLILEVWFKGTFFLWMYFRSISHEIFIARSLLQFEFLINGNKFDRKSFNPQCICFEHIWQNVWHASCWLVCSISHKPLAKVKFSVEEATHQLSYVYPFLWSWLRSYAFNTHSHTFKRHTD